MTTVCFRGGIMASDSKCTDSFSAFVTRSPKIIRLTGGALLGCAGDADVRDIVKLLGNVKRTNSLPSRSELASTKTDFYGILVLPDESLFYVDIYVLERSGDSEWTAQVVENHEKMAAVGSGQQFAMGALASGMSAVQAVTIACRYDSLSGLPVREVPLKPEGKKGAKK